MPIFTNLTEHSFEDVVDTEFYPYRKKKSTK